MNRIRICESEASETQYWLEVIKDADLLPASKLKPEHQECSELLALFTTISQAK